MPRSVTFDRNYVLKSLVIEMFKSLQCYANATSLFGALYFNLKISKYIPNDFYIIHLSTTLGIYMLRKGILTYNF